MTRQNTLISFWISSWHQQNEGRKKTKPRSRLFPLCWEPHLFLFPRTCVFGDFVCLICMCVCVYVCVCVVVCVYFLALCLSCRFTGQIEWEHATQGTCACWHIHFMIGAMFASKQFSSVHFFTLNLKSSNKTKKSRGVDCDMGWLRLVGSLQL